MWDTWLRTGAVPGLPELALAVAVATLLQILPVTRVLAGQVYTIAHEGGHAAAAVVARREVQRVHIRADGSGTTYTRGTPGGLGSALVSFAGYPFPALCGAAMLVAAADGRSRLVALVVAVALLLMLLQMRNLHGAAMVALATAGSAAALRWLSEEWLVVAVIGTGWLLLTGSVRPLLNERRGRRRGRRDSDVSALSERGRLPATAYWLAMVAVVLTCAWWAVSAWAGAVDLSW